MAISTPVLLGEGSPPGGTVIVGGKTYEDKEVYDYTRYQREIKKVYRHNAAVQLGCRGGLNSGKARKH